MHIHHGPIKAIDTTPIATTGVYTFSITSIDIQVLSRLLRSGGDNLVIGISRDFCARAQLPVPCFQRCQARSRILQYEVFYLMILTIVPSIAFT
jgi:hypothetical protein